MRSCRKSIIREFTKISNAIENIFNRDYPKYQFKTNVDIKDSLLYGGEELGITINIYDKYSDIYCSSFYIPLCHICKPPLESIQYIIRDSSGCDVICDSYSSVKEYFIECAKLTSKFLYNKIENNEHLTQPMTNPFYN